MSRRHPAPLVLVLVPLLVALGGCGQNATPSTEPSRPVEPPTPTPNQRQLTPAQEAFSRGEAWFDKGDWANAIKEYDEAIRLDPKFAWAFSRRGYSRHKAGHVDEAIADFDEAIRLNPKDAFILVDRG